MALRAFGPYNGTLPIPTGMVQGFMRDPSRLPFVKYAQYVPAPEVLFSWFRLDPDEAVRLLEMNQFAWAYDDYRPSGAGWNPRVEEVADRIHRWDFPYRIGNRTVQTWRRSGIEPQALFDRIRMNHAMLHRAVRAVGALQSIPMSKSLQTLMPDSTSFKDASGEERIGGITNPNFLLIKRTFQKVKKFLNLSTNSAITGEEMFAIIPPSVALEMGATGEMFEALKQSQFAKELTDPSLADWNLPPSYGGFRLVVEDTPRCFIPQSADGTTVANVEVPSEKDYILSEPSIHFTSRVGGLDGGYGFANFSTIQIYTLNGEAQVKAFPEPKHDLTEGHIEMEDRVVLGSPTSGFRLTDVLG